MQFSRILCTHISFMYALYAAQVHGNRIWQPFAVAASIDDALYTHSTMVIATREPIPLLQLRTLNIQTEVTNHTHQQTMWKTNMRPNEKSPNQPHQFRFVDAVGRCINNSFIHFDHFSEWGCTRYKCFNVIIIIQFIPGVYHTAFGITRWAIDEKIDQ